MCVLIINRHIMSFLYYVLSFAVSIGYCKCITITLVLLWQILIDVCIQYEKRREGERERWVGGGKGIRKSEIKRERERERERERDCIYTHRLPVSGADCVGGRMWVNNMEVLCVALNGEAINH